MKTYTKDELKNVLENHKRWVKESEGWSEADKADLCGADLIGANLLRYTEPGDIRRHTKGRTNKMNNSKVRIKMMECGIKQWELARLLGMSESVLSRKLRDELPEEEQEQMRFANGNCSPMGGFCTSNNIELCEAMQNAYENGRNDFRIEVLQKNSCTGCKYFDEEHMESICYDCKRAYGDRYEG